MKALIAGLFILTSFAASAESVRQAVTRVEIQNDAACTQVDQTWKKCLNTLCYYSNKYYCSSDLSDFELVVKIKEYTKFDGEKVIKTRGIKIND